MAGDFAASRVAAARAELTAALDHLRAANARTAAQIRLTPEKKDALTAAARGGEMGPEMRELAAIVARGEDSWDAIISGGSPNSALYRGFFERAMNTHRDYLTRQFQQDETIQRDIQETIVQQRRGELG